ncbi:TonB-dependent receptor domain-containing protein [Enterovibrio baiacu]|uniref:TonB-dependent receptor domain-containing protein n=1 Tax=Enterovibrio baiacu TaxID=2491023 RepID=UPI001012BD2D|nr:TonB-dependent receptor [Enterovibrio baiacu]MBE1276987.1 TonB-dependent receptor [Enterovibrio baiacu]
MSHKYWVAGMLPMAVFAHAETTTPSIDDTMVVTASGYEQPIKDVIAPVSIVTREDIDAIQANSLTEVLRRLPGVQVSSNGGYGQLSRVYVRGSDNVLVLLNGVRIGSATAGFVNLGQLPLTGIERIEFVRGSRAAVYGADASSGVINIITIASPSSYGGEVKAGTGSNGYYQVAGSASNAIGENSWAKVAANLEAAEGYSVLKDADTDDDGFKNKDVLLEFGHKFNDNLTALVNGYYHSGFVEYDTSYVSSDETDNVVYNVSGQLEYRDEKLASSFTLATNRDEGESKGAVIGSTIVTEREYANWRSSYAFLPGYLVGFGLEYSNDSVKDSTLISRGEAQQYEKTSRDNHAAYMTLSRDIDQVQLEGSVRYDDNEQFGDEVTWQLGAGYWLTNEFRVTANSGTGFKVPTYNSLYWPGSSNPSLMPEETQDYEIAVEGYQTFADWRLSAFRSDITNRISCQDNSACTNDNVRIEGIELTSQFDTGPLSHVVTLEFLDPKDRDENGRQVARISKQNAKWDMTYYGDAWQTTLSYLYQSDRYDYIYGGGVHEMPAYSLVDLSGSYNITDALIVSGRVANLFDESYELARGYNQPERSFYATVTYEF